MTTAAPTVPAHPAEEHALAHLKFHPSVHHGPRRLRLNTAGLWLFFLSECFLFSALLAGRFYLTGLDRPEHLNQMLGLGITSVLLLSSITAYQAETAIRQGQQDRCLAYLWLTIVLGLMFTAGVAFEWAEAEFHVSEPYGTAFFSMTGLHATHVISGIGLLALVYRLVRRGRFDATSNWGVEAVVKYWHFVDVVWVFFYPALYLLNW